MLPSFPIAAVPIWFADSSVGTFLRLNPVDCVRDLQPGTEGVPRAEHLAAVVDDGVMDGDVVVAVVDDDEHYNAVRLTYSWYTNDHY